MLSQFISQPHKPTFFEIFSGIPLSSSLAIGSLTHRKAKKVIDVERRAMEDYMKLETEKMESQIKEYKDYADVKGSVAEDLQKMAGDADELVRIQRQSLEDRKKELEESVTKLSEESKKKEEDYLLKLNEGIIKDVEPIFKINDVADEFFTNVLKVNIKPDTKKTINYPYLEISKPSNGNYAIKIKQFSNLKQGLKNQYQGITKETRHSDKSLKEIIEGNTRFTSKAISPDTMIYDSLLVLREKGANLPGVKEFISTKMKDFSHEMAKSQYPNNEDKDKYKILYQLLLNKLSGKYNIK